MFPPGIATTSLTSRAAPRVFPNDIQQAAQRQVVVLTHDIYFLRIPMAKAKAVGAQIATQSLIRRAERFGVADSATFRG